MTVRDLLRILDGVHPSTVVLTPGPDHSYKGVKAIKIEAVYDKHSGWYEGEAEDGVKLYPVVLIESDYG